MATREVPVNADSAKRAQQSQPVNAPDMYQIAARVLGEVIDDRYDVDELLETKQLTEDTRDRRARFELRYKEVRISERGTIGKQSQRMFEGTFRLQLHGVWKELQDEQPNAGWVPVAAVIEGRYLGAQEAVADKQADGNGLTALYASSIALLQDGKPQAIGQAKKFVEVADTQMVARIAFADLAQGEITDPVASHEDGKDTGGSFSKYAQTRNLRHLPPGFQKRRRLATDVIRLFYEERPRERVDSKIAAAPKVPEQLRREDFSEAAVKLGLAARTENKTWKEAAAAMGIDPNDEAGVARARKAVLRLSEKLSNPGSGVDADDVKRGQTAENTPTENGGANPS